MQYRNRHHNNSRNKADKVQINSVLYLIIFAVVVIIINVSGLIAYFTSTVSAQNDFTIDAEYEIIFNANGGTGTMPNQRLSYNVQTPLSANSYTLQDYTFVGWNTQADGLGTSYSDQQGVTNLIGANNQPVTLYAQWTAGNAVAEVNGTTYGSLQLAIDAVTTPNVETTITLLQDTNEVLTVEYGQNIVFNLQNYTVGNDGSSPVFVNKGTMKIINGTITTEVSQGAINNESTGVLIITGGNIITTKTTTRQAIYNNGGRVEISGNAYLESKSTSRATVQNQANSTLVITGGTIVSTGQNAVQNAGTMTIGVEDGNVSTTSPVLQGASMAITSTTNYSIYDGILKGRSKPMNDATKATNKESGYNFHYSTESIGGLSYQTATLASVSTIHFDPNGGLVLETTRDVEIGDEIGTLPIPLRAGYDFLGWFTTGNGGTQITASTLVTEEKTYYAHWGQSNTAEVNGVIYLSLAQAISAVPANTQTTVTLLKNTTDNVTVPANKNIIFDLGGYTVSTAGNNPVIKNSGTIEISNGTIEQSFGFAAIDNNNSGKVSITGGNVISTGGKGAIYADSSARVEISGNAYLSSNASGVLDGNPRATIQTASASATVIIKGGTIVSTAGIGISSKGTLIIGDNDGSVSTTNPSITAKTRGVYAVSTFEFYDGIIRGETDAIDGTITAVESGYQKVDDTETIGGVTYQTAYLDQI